MQYTVEMNDIKHSYWGVRTWVETLEHCQPTFTTIDLEHRREHSLSMVIYRQDPAIENDTDSRSIMMLSGRSDSNNVVKRFSIIFV